MTLQRAALTPVRMRSMLSQQHCVWRPVTGRSGPRTLGYGCVWCLLQPRWMHSCHSRGPPSWMAGPTSPPVSCHLFPVTTPRLWPPPAVALCVVCVRCLLVVGRRVGLQGAVWPRLCLSWPHLPLGLLPAHVPLEPSPWLCVR